MQFQSDNPHCVPGFISPLADIRQVKKAWSSVQENGVHYDPQHGSSEAAGGPTQCRFNPYSDEGGTSLGIAGDDFVVVGSDTRLSLRGFAVMTRQGEKLHVLNSKIVLGTAGFYGDILQLVKVLETRMKVYKFNFHSDMSVDSAAEMLSRNLYYKRFFPFYVANLLAGIDSNGKGALYTYDPVGTIEKVGFTVQGASTHMIDPFLDNQVGWNNQPTQTLPKMTCERAQAIVRDAFRSAAERDTTTGDSLRLITIVKDKPPVEEIVQLRKD